MPRTACWSAQASRPSAEQELSSSSLLPFCILLISVSVNGCACRAPPIVCCRFSRLRVTACRSQPKASIHAGPREPTAVYLAAFERLCQQQKPGFHRFFTVFLGFFLFLGHFWRFHMNPEQRTCGKPLSRA